MIREDIEKGLRVITRTVEDRPGLLVIPQYLRHRQENTEGVVVGPVPKHNGAWWVRHSHGIAPYYYHEFEMAEDQHPEPKSERLYPNE